MPIFAIILLGLLLTSLTEGRGNNNGSNRNNAFEAQLDSNTKLYTYNSNENNIHEVHGELEIIGKRFDKGALYQELGWCLLMDPQGNKWDCMRTRFSINIEEKETDSSWAKSFLIQDAYNAYTEED